MARLLPIIAGIATLVTAVAAESEWSESVNGLRGRLALERQKDSPFLKVFIELENTSDALGMKKVRFTPEALQAQVTDEHGTPLKAPLVGAYSVMTPRWEPLQIPFEGTTRFRISFPGLGYRPGEDRTIVDLGPNDRWIIPDDQSYFLAGKLTLPKQEGDHPHLDWNGTLDLPKIPIPTK